jgi:hypothetical protein
MRIRSTGAKKRSSNGYQAYKSHLLGIIKKDPFSRYYKKVRLELRSHTTTGQTSMIPEGVIFIFLKNLKFL